VPSKRHLRERHVMNIAVYVIAGLMTLNSLATIAIVGKPRKPVTPAMAASLVLFNALYITILVIAAGRLG
jgi:hypothetical protein